jgi:pimeloyl-ACP methyl ester carboxylesterase
MSKGPRRPGRILHGIEKLTRYVLNRAGLASRVVVVAGGVRLHVYDGPGRGSLPPVVLLHGLGASASTWAALGSMLQPHVRRIVIPELPGHGFTEHPGQVVTPSLLQESLVAALDELLDEPAILVGNSLGGALAIHVATTRPSMVAGLVLLSPAGAQLPEAQWNDVRKAFSISSRREALALIDRIYHQPKWFVALFAHEFPELMGRPAVQELLATATNAHAVTPDALAALAMPVLLVWGQSEKLLPVEALAYFRAHLPPHAVVEQPEGLGHVPQVDDPPRIASRILAFARACVASRPPLDARAGMHAPANVS